MSVLRKLRKLSRLIVPSNYRRGLRFSVAAAVEHEFILRRTNWQTVVDIGANRGQFALTCRHCCPKARVHSFEPLSGPAQTFSSLFAADALVKLTRSAIGPEKQVASMHVSNRDDSSSLLPISELQSSLFPGTGEVGKETVEIGPLQEFIDLADIRSPALLKIDVQGYELEAINGCLTLLGCFDAVYVECSFIVLYDGQALADELIRKLSECGFRLAGMHNPVCDAEGVTIQADFLFEKA
jgi:FkbM family methyltransferase